MAGVGVRVVAAFAGGICVVGMRFAIRAIFLRRAVRRPRMLATTMRARQPPSVLDTYY